MTKSSSGPSQAWPLTNTRSRLLVRALVCIISTLFGGLCALLSPAPTGAVAGGPPSWNAGAAAGYLDKRQAWWMSWGPAQRDRGTACVSCHTALSYAISRPALRKLLGETAPSATERAMLDGITKRVNLWAEVQPFYTDAKDGPPKSAESRGTEAVLNALILARYDAERGKLSDTTRAAFSAAWSLQLKSGDKRGAWDWLNFHNAPWESNESQYWGATLAAIGIGLAPDNYLSAPEIQLNLKLLRDYLAGAYQAQPMFNRIVLLWASARFPGLLTPEQRASLVNSVFDLQREDGGWSLASLGTWKRRDNTPLEAGSDGYATGLIVLALEKTGIRPDQPQISRAVKWLAQNQDAAEGLWRASSLNKHRDPSTEVGHFMSDAATAYAVMALQGALQEAPQQRR